MPIEFAPPQSNVNYQITPAQYTDPLQTLAQMGQLRTQNLQQQTAQMQLEQERRKMDSQKGVIRWLADMNKPEATQETQPAAPAAPSPAPSADTGTGGFTPISGYTPVTPPTPAPVTAAPTAQPQPQPSSDSGFLGRMARDAGKYGILPDDWFAIQNHYLDYKQKSATLSEAQKKIDSDNADAMAGAYRQLAQNKTADQGDLNAVNNGLIARGVPREWLMTALPAGHGDVTPQMMIQAHGNTQLKLAQMLENEQKQSAAAASQATVTKEGVLTDEAKQKVDAGEKAAVAQELQNADTDEAGTPTPAAAAAIQQRHPKVILPTTKAGIDRFVRSVVPPEKQPEYDVAKNRAAQGITGTDDFQSVFLPAYAGNLGKTIQQMSPTEKMAAFSVYKQYDTNPVMLQSILASREETKAMHQATLANQEFQRGQQSYQYTNNEIDKVAKPVQDTMGRLQRLRDTVAQNSPQADALVAPELLSVMAGGAGSGVRMNEAEISRIVGGRSKWEDFKAAVNKWSLDPKTATSITPEQRQEIRGLIEAVGTKVAAKQQIINDARSGLFSNDPMEHRTTLRKAQQALADVDTGGGGGGGAAGGPAGTVAVPLKNGSILWLPPAGAAKFRTEHPERVK